jgi:ribonucleoside-diphosphate reductase alpha chain/ribonucleoside-triphosphate reductase
MCNLTTVNVMAFVQGENLDIEGLIDAQALSARSGYRMTMVELELPEWDVVQQRDKLIGCSLTGWQDMVNAVHMPMEDQAYLLKVLRDVAQMAAEEYAESLNSHAPILVTTVKPEGTLSQLPVVSSGVHYSHSPYYIRRIRVNSHDPIVKVCEELGYPVLPEVGQEWDTCKTKVVEFPVKAPEGTTKNDVSAIEQLENYKMFMENYVDHNCSITVHVRDHEWDEVEEWLWEHWDDVVAVSFLSLDDNFYDLLPYEEITVEQYNERKEQMVPFVPALISKYETDEVVELLEDACASGSCPIR